MVNSIMQQAKWTDRKFAFEYPDGWMPDILERLRGTHLRIQGFIRDVAHEQLIRSSNGKWSIQEHIGHLSDLEEIHDGRIDDFLQRKKILRAADMSNTKTNEAHHNERDVKDLLNEFDEKRNHFIQRLESLDAETLSGKALHPRLQVLMRPVDLAFFTAEHDDHHLASMRELKNML